MFIIKTVNFTHRSVLLPLHSFWFGSLLYFTYVILMFIYIRITRFPKRFFNDCKSCSRYPAAAARQATFDFSRKLYLHYITIIMHLLVREARSHRTIKQYTECFKRFSMFLPYTFGCPIKYV